MNQNSQNSQTIDNSQNENGFLNIIINILIPVFILNKLSTHLGPKSALVLAISFPLFYGAFSYFKHHKKNYFSLLGLINVIVTGGMALLGLTGHWFAIKEAFFPLLIGVFVFTSSFTKNPFIKNLILNPQLMNIDLIHQKLEEKQEWNSFLNHLKTSTQFLSVTFFVSAILNFVLAIKVFTPIDPALDETARSVALNEQIGQMTTYSFAVILIPSVLMMSAIMWYLLNGIKKSTDLNIDQFMKS